MPTLTAYASPANLQAYCDWREVGELITDSNETLSGNDQTTNPILIELLNLGAGEIEANLMVSGMYTIAQLQALTGNSLELLIAMNCSLTLFWIYNRKPLQNQEKWKLYREMRKEALKDLSTGINVFNITANINAGTPEAKGLSTVEYADSGLVPYYPGMHYFPVPRSIMGNG